MEFATPPAPTQTDPPDPQEPEAQTPGDTREGTSTLASLTEHEPGEDRNLTLTERLYVDHAEGRIDDRTALRYLLAAVAGCQDDIYADERENEQG
jgi:hypothetical protein